MALLAEEVVEEWLNRHGYFTIRGIKLGVHEIDILAFRPDPKGQHECRHVEVQVSSNPVSYISRVPKRLQRTLNLAPNNAKVRPREMIEEGITEWIANKFDHPRKVQIRERLFPGTWSRELVVHRVKHQDELKLFQNKIKVIHLKDIVQEMVQSKLPIEAASGNDLIILMRLLEELGDGSEHHD